MGLKYAVVIEKGPKSYGASVPDLPGCVAVHKTLPGVRKLIREAIEFHIEGLREDGAPVPPPTTTVTAVPVRQASAKSRRTAAKSPAKRRALV